MDRVEERLKALEDERPIRALVTCFADVCTSGDGSVYQSLATYDDQFTHEAGEWLFLERSCTFLDIFSRNEVEL